MSKPTGDPSSPIRRISKEEKASNRQWPDKKHLASNHDIPLPKPGEKNRIHSVLVALPVLMLMIGLYVYYSSESAQNNGAPVLSAMETRQGQFKSMSKVSGIGQAKHFVWYFVGEAAKGARVTEAQAHQLSQLKPGDDLLLELVPRVEGSNTLWVYSLSYNNTQLISPPALKAK